MFWIFLVLYLSNFSNVKGQESRLNDGFEVPLSENVINGDEIPGIAGIDYPVFSRPPRTSFSCDSVTFPGYYADTESRCQAFYVCQRGGKGFGFLCPNGTLFSQEVLVCDWWNNVRCERSLEFYAENQRIFTEMNAANEKLGIPTIPPPPPGGGGGGGSGGSDDALSDQLPDQPNQFGGTSQRPSFPGFDQRPSFGNQGGGSPFGGGSPSGGGSPFGGGSPTGGGSPFGGPSSGGGSPFGGGPSSGGGSPFGGSSPSGGGSPFGGGPTSERPFPGQRPGQQGGFGGPGSGFPQQGRPGGRPGSGTSSYDPFASGQDRYPNRQRPPGSGGSTTPSYDPFGSGQDRYPNQQGPTGPDGNRFPGNRPGGAGSPTNEFGRPTDRPGFGRPSSQRPTSGYPSSGPQDGYGRPSQGNRGPTSGYGGPGPGQSQYPDRPSSNQYPSGDQGYNRPRPFDRPTPSYGTPNDQYNPPSSQTGGRPNTDFEGPGGSSGGGSGGGRGSGFFYEPSQNQGPQDGSSGYNYDKPQNSLDDFEGYQYNKPSRGYLPSF